MGLFSLTFCFVIYCHTISFTVSKEVECTTNKVLENQIDLSLNKLDQEDPILIQAVKNLLIPPPDPSVSYNFTSEEPGTNSTNFFRILIRTILSSVSTLCVRKN